MLSVDMVYSLCNRNQWFTNGDNEQYDRMFDLVRMCAPVMVIAAAIWICSDTSKWTVGKIIDKLMEAACAE